MSSDSPFSMDMLSAAYITQGITGLKGDLYTIKVWYRNTQGQVPGVVE